MELIIVTIIFAVIDLTAIELSFLNTLRKRRKEKHMKRHIVEYEKYCKTCLYSEKPETEDPCDECLNSPINEDSRRPVNYKEDPNAKDSKKTVKRDDR